MIVSSKSEFKPHPITDGPIDAVIVDMTEPELKDTKFGKKEKFAIIFETSLKMEDGKHWTHWDHGYTPSWDEKSTLRKNVSKLLGGDPGGDTFDVETLIGRPVKVIIEHKTDDGKTYANITYYGANKSSDPFRGSGEYVRRRDKDKTDTGSSYNKAADAPEQKESWQQTKVHVGKFTGQHLENLPTDAVESLIKHWIPIAVDGYKAKPEDPPYKVTADDRRLIAALGEAKKVIDALNAPKEEKLF